MHVLDGVDGEMQCVEHPEPEQVELDDADGGAVVLVPLEDRAFLHPPPLQRHHLPQGAVGDHHPPGVDPEMAGKAVEAMAHLVDELGGEPLGERCLEPQLGDIAGVDILRQPVDLRLGEPERLADVTEH